jgi:GDPmannose 4,6-dehydratase
MWLMMQHRQPDDFLVATGEERTVRDLCQLVFKKVGLGDYSQYVVCSPRYVRPYELNRLRGNAAKARTVLGWQVRYTFEQLIDEMIAYFESEFQTSKR